MFGLRVCVKRPGDRRCKLDMHDYTGIFLGYTATDQNIRYLIHPQALLKLVIMQHLMKLGTYNPHGLLLPSYYTT
jgi:hypothetical protein